ncbi:MAG TPA: hypothetical protein VFX47_05485 [Gammaproteobacteria bacterium]|nr:hypothetical protein [Gammaproteobacteria bacterium]
MIQRLFLATLACLAIVCVRDASAASLEAGDCQFMLQTIAVFTNGGTLNGNSPYYDTNGSYTNYNFAAGLGFGLGADFEAGFNVGFGHLNTTGCSGYGCRTDTVENRQWSLFVRHDFSPYYDDDSDDYAFSGIEFSAVYPVRGFGHITALRPYVGYRFGMPQDWALELSVGSFQVVSGTAEISSGYELRAGLTIPL